MSASTCEYVCVCVCVYCPRHPTIKLKRAALDLYWCDLCERAWLIKPLTTYRSYEEATKVPSRRDNTGQVGQP